ncbi:helix-turn-helix transcriptional regulator [Allosalinactinospora lopnorensis]|uniref:helix-turn-helix transcriptional regulator n=1 Tax=Allosalinactinospora lopnorensis TaxID=1352348 RepID=UPI000623DF26|nr:YafY family protein [Allosalinactinospora lopnorensis]
MLETSARLLRLLSLLQTRPDRAGAELAERLGVAARTVRRDVERLRSLGYPIHAIPGVSGGYRLGAGARMPPLLLDDEEAVAVAVGLHTAAGSSVVGIEEASVRALAKLEQVLPSRLRHRVGALRSSTVTIGDDEPSVPPDVLTVIAGACRASERPRFDYVRHDGAASLRLVEPHRLVSWSQRWYLVAWDTERDGWRTFRVDRIRPRPPTGPRFTPRDPPEGDVATYLYHRIGSVMWPIQARVLVHAPVETVAGQTMGVVEAIDEHSCLLRVGGETVPLLTAWIGVIDADFEILDPPEFAEHARRLAERYRRAAAKRPPAAEPQ